MPSRNENIKLTISANDKAGKKLSSIQQKIIGIGAAYLGWRAVTGILSDIVRVGAEHERVWINVEGALKKHNQAMDDGIGRVKQFADELQTLTGISDEAIGTGVQLFVDYGQNLDEAMDTMRVAADFAAGSGMELKSAIDLLAKASVGYTSTLSRYGLIIDESIPKTEKFAAAVDLINQRFGGAAQRQADTTAVRIALLTEKFGDLKEQIFKLFSPTLLSGVQTTVDVVSGIISTLTEWNKETEEVRTEAGKAVDKFHQWTEQLKSLRIQLKEGKIDLETFRKEIEKIGKISVEPIDPEHLDLIRQAGESLGVLSDATGSWAAQSGFTKEQLIELYDQIEKLKAEKAFEKQKEQAELFALRMAAVTESVEEFGDVGPMVIERFTKVVEKSNEALRLMEEVERDILDGMIEAHALEVQQFEEAEEAKREFISDTVNFAVYQSDRMADAIVDAVYGARLDLQKIWAAMARDFLTLFVRKILNELAASFAVELLKILKIFDVAANDRMAMEQGAHFAQFFKQGVMGEMSGYAMPSMLASSPMPAMAFGGGGGSSYVGPQVTVNVNAPITSDQFKDFVVHDMAPIIENAAKLKQTKITLDPFVQTGDRSGIIN